jgi:type II secretory pathway pseudopilin PulG
MSKTKIALIVIVATTAGLAVSLLIHQRSQAELQQNENLLRDRDGQLAEISKDNQRLSNQVAGASGPIATGHQAELAKLRSEADALKKQTKDLAKQTEARHPNQPAAPAPVEHPPEYWDQLHQLSGAKGGDARNMASAMLEYATDHQGQFPTNTDQMASYIAKPERSLSGTNRFEIVYHGTVESLQGVSRGAVALVRDLETWPGPDGKMMRVYGLADGTGQIVQSDDNFKTWESQHIISESK